jgi:hypothetical protein
LAWQDDFLPDFDSIWDNLMGPGLLYRLERQFWLDLWRAPVLDVVEDAGIETRRYGPVQATVVATLPRTPLLNVVLGAADPGAIEAGHLAEALDWLESLEVDFRIPLRPDVRESAAAEDHLNQRGYHRTANLVRFVHDLSAPDFPEPPGIEIDEWTEEIEGFSDYFAEPFGLEYPGHAFFDSLLGRCDWRCYVAIDENEEGVGAATMMRHHPVAQLGFAATTEQARRKGVHMALLRRRILDAAAAGSELMFADTEEPIDPRDDPSQASRNLVRAGFKPAAVRHVWQPPREGRGPSDERPGLAP